jgi:hypothetical protein
VKLNFCLLPSRESRQLIAAASSALERIGITTFLALGYEPHCTLFMTDFPNDACNLVLESAKQIKMNGVQLGSKVLPGYAVTRIGWIFLNLTPIRRLSDLAKLARHALAPLRSPQIQKPAWIEPGSEKERMFLRFGSPNVGIEFEPHISLAKTSSSCNISSPPPLDIEDSTIWFDRLALGVANTEGQFKDYTVVG